MYSLVIGYGEIGKAVYDVFSKCYFMHWLDKNEGTAEQNVFYDYLHIAIPYSESFVDIVNGYIKRFNPNLTIIHSTVAIGTTEKIDGFKVHCPIRGRHSMLADAIKQYKLVIGYETESDLKLSKNYIARIVSNCEFVEGYKTTEAAKLLSLLQYGMNIEFARYSKGICDRYGVDYLVAVKEYTKSYNDTIKQIDSADLTKTILDPPTGKIGGHCVIPGIKILNKQMEDSILSGILEKND